MHLHCFESLLLQICHNVTWVHAVYGKLPLDLRFEHDTGPVKVEDLLACKELHEKVVATVLLNVVPPSRGILLLVIDRPRDDQDVDVQANEVFRCRTRGHEDAGHLVEAASDPLLRGLDLEGHPSLLTAR